ncbi:hypothetical protein KQI84_09050 [bacterium]|nr:hypothetical protein [bacterium]
MKPLRILATILVLTLAAGSMSACSWYSTNRCYLSIGRYRAMKQLYLETGSYQRVEQAMEDLQWAACERRQFRYQLQKDLYLDDLSEEVATEELLGQAP